MSDLTPPETFAGAHLVSEAQEDLRILQEAAEALANTRTIDTEDRAQALAAALRLLVMLEESTAGDAVDQARDIIATLDHAGLPQPERLQAQVHALSLLLFSGPGR